MITVVIMCQCLV